MSEAWGFVATLAACGAFGSLFLPLKGIEIGDGMMYQWLYASGVLVIGVIAHIISMSHIFYSLAMLSGALMACANIVVIPMFHFLGIAPSFLLWTSAQMVVGWAVGRFGVLGIPPEEPASLILNYSGLALSIIGGIFFIFINNSRLEHHKADIYTTPMDDMNHMKVDGEFGKMETFEEDSFKPAEHKELIVEVFMPQIPQGIKKIIGIGCALYAGTLFGLMFTPIMYIQSRRNQTDSEYYGATTEGLPYALAFFTGSFATSTIFLIIYCLYKVATKSRIFSPPELIFRSILSGIMLGLGLASWLFAISVLSASITTPLTTRLPGAIQTLFGIFYFREIRGLRNYIIVAVGTVIVILGSILSGLSRSMII